MYGQRSAISDQRSAISDQRAPPGWRRDRVLSAGWRIFSATVAGLICFAAGCSQAAVGGSTEIRHERPSHAAAAGPELRVQTHPPGRADEPQAINLGTVRWGESVRRTLSVENNTADPAVIDGYDTSCECLRLVGLPLAVASGGEARFAVLLNETDEHDFRGTLGIAVRVHCGSARTFLMNVEAAIVPPEGSGMPGAGPAAHRRPVLEPHWFAQL